MAGLRFLAFLVVLIPSFARAADAPTVPWHTVPKTAMAVARAQQKMLLVYFRESCDRCNDASDRMFEQAARDDVFQRALDTFLPLRVDETSPEREVLPELTKAKGPLVAIYDASGVQLSTLPPHKLKWNDVGELLLRFRPSRGLAARAAEVRLKGDAAAADFVIGHAMLNGRESRRAAERFEMAARAFEMSAEKEAQQIAQITAGHAWYAHGMKSRGRKQIEDVLRAAVSKAVEAEAHFQLGAIHESQQSLVFSAPSSTPIATPGKSGRPDGSGVPPATRRAHSKVDTLRAISAYRKAYELAPAGSSTHEAARAALARLDDAPLAPKGEATGTLRLIPPARQTVTGEAEFLAQAGPGVARVDFFLEEKQVSSERRAPFRATIDVGPTARARTIKARAFDAAGNAVGDAVVTINDRLDTFAVTIVAPATDMIENAADVELAVRVPPGRTLKNVEVSWNGEPLANLTAPPFRTRLATNGELGYLRALAQLDDGTTTEATKLFNTVSSATVEVAAVTAITTVLTADGKRIAGLRAADFVVHDEGRQVEPTLRSSDDEPVTIGIAIDSSSSMAGKQLYVIRAAVELIERGLRPQDEAFVVAFDTTSRLVHQRSKNVGSLRSAVLDLVPRGGTSLFDGVTFALQQMQGIPGKRALVVLTDGREGSSSASARECERLARALGVPIYLLVPPRGEKNGHALLAIAEATGGTLLYAPPAQSLAATAERVADEVRGQYVLSFTRPAGVKAGEWRSIRVAVRGRDAIVRTIQGYRAN
ncbi:MAG TPA: VWA domain-containing protein [Thermoanaerobaculia bacterium]|nr:VWA domain-containing protein [Thermoanaerobaculia bacterium]